MDRGRDSGPSVLSEITVAGRRLPIPEAEVRQIAAGVLEAEGRSAIISVTFLGAERMRQLNLQYKSHDRPTDVLAFPLPDPGGRLLGDVYICPWVARQEAEARDIPLRVEIARLVIHGTLHVLGYDHPEGEGRTTSAMWQRQEDYLRALT